MEQLDLGMILDVVVAILLLATIAYCSVLYRRLSGLRDSQAQLEGMIAEFDKATVRAQSGVGDLRRASQDLGGQLQGEMEAARALADELAVMNESGRRLADRIEEGLDTARDRRGRENSKDRTTAPGMTVVDGGRASAAPTDARSEAERELLAALRQAR